MKPTVSKFKILGVLGLPLIALLAVAMFLTFANNDRDTAEAASATSMGMSLKSSSVKVARFETFTVTVNTNLFPQASDGIDFATGLDPKLSEDGAGPGTCGNFQDDGGDTLADKADPECLGPQTNKLEIRVRYPIGLVYKGSTGDNTDPSTPPCPNDIFKFETQDALASQWGVCIVQNTDPTLAVPGVLNLSMASTPIKINPGTKGAALANVTFTCAETGDFVIELPAGLAAGGEVGGAAYGGAQANPIGVPGDTIDVTCNPANGEINIDKVDAKDSSLFLSGSCFTILPFSPAIYPAQTSFTGTPKAGPSGGLFCDGDSADGNAAAGQIDIVVTGAQQLADQTGTYAVVEVVPPDKYALDEDPQLCLLEAAGIPIKCNVVFENTLLGGKLNVTFTDKVDGSVSGDPKQCVDIAGKSGTSDPAITKVCDGQTGDDDPAAGAIEINIAFGDYAVTLQDSSVPAGRIVDEAQGALTQNCQIANTPLEDRKCNVSYAYAAAVPRWQKLSKETGTNLGNLFLTAGDPPRTKLPPLTCEQGSDTHVFNEVLSRPVTTVDPKAVDIKGEPLSSAAIQEIGAFEFEVRFDQKLICVELEAGPGATNMDCVIKNLDGIGSMHCVSKKGAELTGDLHLATLTVRPQPELYSMIIANQENGTVAQLLDQDCNLADRTGHPIPILSCEDAELTIRFLEGDVNADCNVNSLDQQQIAFRWNAELGNLLYNSRYDLEPSVSVGGNSNGDGDIDIKDLQFVFGRHLSNCAEPNPAQPPVNGKNTNFPN